MQKSAVPVIVCVALTLAFLGAAADAQQAAYLRKHSFELPSKDAAETVQHPVDIAVAPNGSMHVLDRDGQVVVFSETGVLLHSYGASELSRPVAFTISGDGVVLVLDGDKKQVFGFDSEGTPIGAFGKGGDRGGEFSKPVDIAQGPGGLVYVLDAGRKGVQIFSADGLFIRDVMPANLLEEPTAIAVTPDGSIYVSDKKATQRFYELPAFHSLPWEDTFPASLAAGINIRGGQILEIISMATNANGSIFLLDRKTGKVWRRRPADEDERGISDYIYGGLGSSFGSFEKAVGLAFAGVDQLVILDEKLRKVERIKVKTESGLLPSHASEMVIGVGYGHPRRIPAVLVGLDYDSSGVARFFLEGEDRTLVAQKAKRTSFIDGFGHAATGFEPDESYIDMQYSDELSSIAAVAANDSLVVISDPSKNRIAVYDKHTGTLIGLFGDNYQDDRKFDRPQGVTLTTSGRVAVADRNSNKVRILSSDLASVISLEFIKPYGIVSDSHDNLYVWAEDGTEFSFIPTGTQRLERFRRTAFPATIAGLAFDPAGNFIVMDHASQRIRVISPDGQEILFTFGPEKAYREPTGIFVDRMGNVYVSDREEKCTHVYHWTVSLPVPDRFDVVYRAEHATISWDGNPSRYLWGYNVYMDLGDDAGGMSLLSHSRACHVEVPLESVRETTLVRIHIAPTAVSGAIGAMSRAISLPALNALAAPEDQDPVTSAQFAAAALRQLEAEDPDSYRADASTAAGLRLIVFLAAAGSCDYQQTINQGIALRDAVPDAFRTTYHKRMAEAYLATGNPGEAGGHLLAMSGGSASWEYLADSTVIAMTFRVVDLFLASQDTTMGLEFIQAYHADIPDDYVSLKNLYKKRIGLVSARIKLSSGLVYWQAQDYEAASDFFREVATKRAADFGLEERVMGYQLLAAALYASGRKTEAKDQYEKIFVLQPAFDLDASLEQIRQLCNVTIYSLEMISFFRDLQPEGR
ncbi:MAG: NHL repeat-containing protein [Candidatus Eisenbacteria sp.]|nr:NHL repeat-containing protein [Candidatus Eisenbacteria bacterium]